MIGGTRGYSEVALLAEGVDRNSQRVGTYTGDGESPSSRRAWIEIWQPRRTPSVRQVALLAEGVDRNSMAKAKKNRTEVALLAEGVDRNY